MDAGQIEVKFIPRDATQARVLIANRTDEPLDVQLPDVFAGVPVLAQFQPQRPFPPGNNQANNNQNNANQAVGGGVNALPGGRQNANPLGQNFFNVPAEQTRKLKVRCVCLEHGKPEPRAAVPYQLVPLDSLHSDPSLAQMLRELGRQPDMDQMAAQAAAWYLTGDLDWTQLAEKSVRRANGARKAYFSEAELDAARQIVAAAEANRTGYDDEKTGENTASRGRIGRNSLGFASQID
jgi:hypothetical protein